MSAPGEPEKHYAQIFRLCTQRLIVRSHGGCDYDDPLCSISVMIDRWHSLLFLSKVNLAFSTKKSVMINKEIARFSTPQKH